MVDHINYINLKWFKIVQKHICTDNNVKMISIGCVQGLILIKSPLLLISVAKVVDCVECIYTKEVSSLFSNDKFQKQNYIYST